LQQGPAQPASAAQPAQDWDAQEGPAGTLKGRRGRSGDGAGEADADEDEHNGSYAGEDYPQSQLSRCFPKVNSYGGTPYLVAVSVDVRATLNCYRG
jgi:hypothetical protein